MGESEASPIGFSYSPPFSFPFDDPLPRLPVVSIPRVGHGDPGGQEPDQPDADHQPGQEDHIRAGPEAPMGLRKYRSLSPSPHVWKAF